ncbi:MAG: flavodoxin family protein [Devosia nanyangense]|uniref:Flavodoxin family protein n=1 Tax=Devosia nanyangense TaxID=1228055 RepID=A0A933L0Y3_9HYPH|nr:flavodoxin family protein [Devosia nanyangense]
MAIVVVYDSIFGNTAQVAKAIAAELELTHTVKLVPVGEARGIDLSDAEMLIVGSPTRGFRPTPLVSEYVEGLEAPSGIAAAAFDTRLDLETIHPAPLRWVVDAGGYAAERIAAMLERHGFVLKAPSAGFLVGGTEGPLNAGEIERAKAWAKTLIA